VFSTAEIRVSCVIAIDNGDEKSDYGCGKLTDLYLEGKHALFFFSGGHFGGHCCLTSLNARCTS
jgi:hypothetical protein